MTNSRRQEKIYTSSIQSYSEKSAGTGVEAICIMDGPSIAFIGPIDWRFLRKED